MSQTVRNLILLLLMALCFCGRIFASSAATITVGGSEQQISGAWDTGTISISFNGFIEAVQYGQYSTPASIASAIAAMFSRDYLPAGLCANASGAVINFKLKGAAIFGALDVTGASTSFQLSSAGFNTQLSKVVDTGTVTLTINGVLAATTNYGDGATPSTIAEGLSAGVTGGSFVNVTAVGNSVYLESKQAGAGTNYSYSLQTTNYDSTDFTQPSFLNPPVTGSLDGGANAGSSAGQTVYSYAASGYDYDDNPSGSNDAVMGAWSFTYDTLNRLISGTPTAGQFAGHNLCWSYDGFGNRTAQIPQTTVCPTLPTVPTATAAYNPNNQVTWTTVNSASGGFIYDAAGDVVNDNLNSYLYDAEGRICAVKNVPIQGIYTMTGYLYDAEGNRIAKGSISTWGSCDPAVNGFQVTNAYIVDPSGEQETELAMDSNNSLSWQHTNVWSGGSLLATYDNDGLHFYLNDPLGTRRAQTDFAGAQEQTCASLPYGDSLACTASAQSPAESHFTGKERDTESGNDYFGARYYSSAMGRFMSPDPSQLAFADSTNPQSFNLYSYAANNPLKFVDPTGMWHCVWDSSTGDVDDKPEDGGATEQQCDDQGGGWTIDEGDDPGQSSITLQMESNHPDAGSVGGAACAALPSAGVQGYSGSLGFLGGPTGSLELVTNYRTGHVSGFAAGGISAGWNNGFASAAGFSGLVSGLKGDNSNYSGGFTSGTIGVSVPVPFVGVQMTGSSSSGGLTGTPRQMIPNPTDPNAVNSVTVGVNAALRGPAVSPTAAVTNYSNPAQLGRYWTILMNPVDTAMFIANQACEAAGH